MLGLVAAAGRGELFFLEAIGAFLFAGGLILALIVAFDSARR